jgi:hypothetical protein
MVHRPIESFHPVYQMGGDRPESGGNTRCCTTSVLSFHFEEGGSSCIHTESRFDELESYSFREVSTGNKPE